MASEAVPRRGLLHLPLGRLPYGQFGHPWEESPSLFCQELLDAASTEVEMFLGRQIRRSGRTVGTA